MSQEAHQPELPLLEAKNPSPGPNQDALFNVAGQGEAARPVINPDARIMYTVLAGEKPGQEVLVPKAPELQPAWVRNHPEVTLTADQIGKLTPQAADVYQKRAAETDDAQTRATAIRAAIRNQLDQARKPDSAEVPTQESGEQRQEQADADEKRAAAFYSQIAQYGVSFDEATEMGAKAGLRPPKSGEIAQVTGPATEPTPDAPDQPDLPPAPAAAPNTEPTSEELGKLSDREMAELNERAEEAHDSYLGWDDPSNAAAREFEAHFNLLEPAQQDYYKRNGMYEWQEASSRTPEQIEADFAQIDAFDARSWQAYEQGQNALKAGDTDKSKQFVIQQKNAEAAKYELYNNLTPEQQTAYLAHREALNNRTLEDIRASNEKAEQALFGRLDNLVNTLNDLADEIKDKEVTDPEAAKLLQTERNNYLAEWNEVRMAMGEDLFDEYAFLENELDEWPTSRQALYDRLDQLNARAGDSTLDEKKRRKARQKFEELYDRAPESFQLKYSVTPGLESWQAAEEQYERDIIFADLDELYNNNIKLGNEADWTVFDEALESLSTNSQAIYEDRLEAMVANAEKRPPVERRNAKEKKPLEATPPANPQAGEVALPNGYAERIDTLVAQGRERLNISGVSQETRHAIEEVLGQLKNPASFDVGLLFAPRFFAGKRTYPGTQLEQLLARADSEADRNLAISTAP